MSPVGGIGGGFSPVPSRPVQEVNFSDDEGITISPGSIEYVDDDGNRVIEFTEDEFIFGNTIEEGSSDGSFALEIDDFDSSDVVEYVDNDGNRVIELN